MVIFMIMMKIIFTAFGVIFSLIGFGVIIGSFAHKNSVKSSREVKAKIVDFTERKHKHGQVWRTYYYPVYEYYDGWEFKRYESNMSSIPKKPLGTEAALYISEDGKVREEQGTSFMLLFGSIFAGVGIIFTAAALILL